MQQLVFPTGEDFVGGVLYDGFDRRCFNTVYHEKLVYNFRESINYLVKNNNSNNLKNK